MKDKEGPLKEVKAPASYSEALKQGKIFKEVNAVQIVQVMEDKESREKNVIVHGVEETKGEDLNKIAEKICYQMDIKTKWVDIRRVGPITQRKPEKSTNQAQAQTKVRPVRIVLANKEERDMVLAAGSKLKGTELNNVYITTDKTAEERSRVALMRKEAENRNKEQAMDLAPKNEQWRVVGKINPRLMKITVPQKA